jgi:sulfur carrier protein
MKVEIGGKIITLEGNKRVREVLKELNLNPETVLVIREDELLTEDAQLYDSDEIKIVNVISGG